MDDKVYVGKLGRTIGLNGSLKLHIESDFPEQFQKGNTLYTQKNTPLKIQAYNKENGTIKFELIETIDEAKKLTNKLLFTSIEDTKKNCPLEKDQYFWFDILNCSVIENDENLGKVVDIQRLPLADYLLIQTDTLLVEKNLPKQFLLPYQDSYILTVDTQNKKILTQNAKDILITS